MITRQQFEEALKKLQTAPRRKEVLENVLKGCTDDKIADSMGVTIGNVRKEISNLYKLFNLKAEFQEDRKSRRSDLIALFKKYKPEMVQVQEESNSTPTPSPQSQPEEKTVPIKKSEIKEKNTEVLVDLVAEEVLSFLKKDFFQNLKNERLKYARKGKKVDYTTAIKKYASEGDYRAAIKYFDLEIRINRNDAEAYNNRGVVNDDLGDYQKAIADFTRAIELDPEFYLAHVNRANIFYKMKDYRAALEDYTTASKLNPNDPNVYYGLGAIYCLLNDYKRALDQFDWAIFLFQNDYTHALKNNSNIAAYYVNRGGILLLTGNWGQACKDYEVALKLFWEQGDRENYKKIDQYLIKIKHKVF